MLVRDAGSQNWSRRTIEKPKISFNFFAVDKILLRVFTRTSSSAVQAKELTICPELRKKSHGRRKEGIKCTKNGTAKFLFTAVRVV